MGAEEVVADPEAGALLYVPSDWDTKRRVVETAL